MTVIDGPYLTEDCEVHGRDH